jgi:hypothetical protein
MQLATRPPAKRHVSRDTVEELEMAILSDPRVSMSRRSPLAVAALTAAARISRKLGVDPSRSLRAQRDSGRTREDYIAVMMGLDSASVAPWFRRPARKSVYLFDAWPSQHAEIAEFLESWGVQFAFVSSSQAAEQLKHRVERCTVLWVPEGVEPSRYSSRSFLERDIDVLQLGRKYDAYHSLIAPALEKAGKSYLYERDKGTLVFPDRAAFIAGLSRARISICTPSSLTHPDRAGGIETMTTRYLQSMTSRCLVVGHAPAEMVELFGYNPVVEIEMGRAADQILEVLEKFEDYVPLIQRNFETVSKSHTWSRRWEQMSKVLFPGQ